MDSNVAKALTGLTSCKLKNESDLLSKRPSSFTATILGAKSVYNLFPGTVLFLGYYKGMGTISIKVSNHEIVRYLNLKDISVWNNSKVAAGDYLGEAFGQSGLQFEYCTQWQGESVYPVRVNTSLFYKQNPMDILNGAYEPTNETNITNGITRAEDIVTFTDDQNKEWANSTSSNFQITINPKADQITNVNDIPPSVLAEFTGSGG